MINENELMWSRVVHLGRVFGVLFYKGAVSAGGA